MFTQVSPWASRSATHVIEYLPRVHPSKTPYTALRRPTGERTTAVEIGRYETFDDAAAACRADAQEQEAA